jgi:hypothetical protein
MIFSFALALVSIVGLSFFDRGTEKVILFAVVLLVAKSGASLAFGFAYAIHIDLFPAHFLISSYGICNFFCRGVTILAPLIAEVENPVIPNGAMIFLSVLGVASTWFLRPTQNSSHH